jgi:uncharacterized protein YbjT (DUF2867 family)
MARIAVAGATGRVGRHVVDVLGERGHDVVAISRSNGVDVITGDGLAAALAGVEVVIDTATGPSPEQAAATGFFTTATQNLKRAGVQKLVVVSIIGTDKYTAGYGAAKLAHERAALAGPIPARILRAAQFHEFVEVLMGWGRQGDVVYLPKMRTQIVAARRGDPVKIEAVSNPADPDDALNENGGLLPSPHATLAGPTFAAWLEAQS